MNTTNQTVALIEKNIAYFKNESIRVRDRGILDEYKNLVDRLFSISSKLSTVAHEVALDELSKEYSHAWNETCKEWRNILDSFKKNRTEIKKFTMPSSNESFIEEKLSDDMEFSNLQQEIYGLMKQADILHKELANDMEKIPFIILKVDLINFFVFLQYFAERFVFFLLRHSFILGLLVLGIIFSDVTDNIVDTFTKYSPINGNVLIIIVALVSKYCLDEIVKKIQIRLESRWLSHVVLRLHIVRSYALMSRTKFRHYVSIDGSNETNNSCC